MIRNYKKADIDEIIRLLDLHNELSEDEIKDKRKELEDGKKVLVYDKNNDIKGLCTLDVIENPELGNGAKIIMSIKDDCDFNEVANSLYTAVQEELQNKSIVAIITHYKKEQIKLSEFFSGKQFKTWFITHGMVYKGGNFTDSKLTFRNYKDKDFYQYYPSLADSFYELRKANDINPHNIYTSASKEKLEDIKKRTLDSKDNIYMFYEDDQLVGSSTVNDNEIDDVFVVPTYQGRGYGRKIMESSINIIKEKGHKEIQLGVLDWNKKAVNLYKSQGFEITETIEYRKLTLN